MWWPCGRRSRVALCVFVHNHSRCANMLFNQSISCARYSRFCVYATIKSNSAHGPYFSIGHRRTHCLHIIIKTSTCRCQPRNLCVQVFHKTLTRHEHATRPWYTFCFFGLCARVLCHDFLGRARCFSTAWTFGFRFVRHVHVGVYWFFCLCRSLSSAGSYTRANQKSSSTTPIVVCRSRRQQCFNCCAHRHKRKPCHVESESQPKTWNRQLFK